MTPWMAALFRVGGRKVGAERVGRVERLGRADL
jgi:hypothetical protein